MALRVRSGNLRKQVKTNVVWKERTLSKSERQIERQNGKLNRAIQQHPTEDSSSAGDHTRQLSCPIIHTELIPLNQEAMVPRAPVKLYCFWYNGSATPHSAPVHPKPAERPLRGTTFTKLSVKTPIGGLVCNMVHSPGDTHQRPYLVPTSMSTSNLCEQVTTPSGSTAPFLRAMALFDYNYLGHYALLRLSE